MISLRPDKNIERRLNFLAKETGRTKTFYVREAIENHLDDMEDIYLANKAYEELQKGNDELISHEDFWNDLGN